MNHPIEKRIHDFWEGKLSSEEQYALLQQLDQEHPEWLQQLAAGYHASVGNTATTQTRKDYFKNQFDILQHSIAEKAAGETTVKPMLYARYKAWWAAAASVILIAISSLFLVKSNLRPSLATRQPAPYTKADDIQVFKLFNTTANLMQATLSDGTALLIHPGSQLSYTSAYGKQVRAVSLLSGKAFFKVAKDKQHPFIVSVEGVEVRALGTAFTIDKTTVGILSVQLAEGRVAVYAASASTGKVKEVFMKPGDHLSIELMTGHVLVDSIATNAKTVKPKFSQALMERGQDHSQLTFHQQEVRQVFAQLENFYRIDIIFNNDDIKDLWFTGTFKTSDSLQIVLGTVCKVNGLAFRHDNGSFVITRK